VVFHAAAHKHVPSVEENLGEAIENNIFGTVNLVQICERFSVTRFVFLSSDKAVNCANGLGATKRAGELFVQKQILDGGPVTITHPEATRYFMTIPEASQLVIQAATLGERGEIFILEMGRPVRILDLARDMIRLSGLREQDIEVKFVGLRPGEKLHEELVYANEEPRKTKFDKILVVDPVATDLQQFEAALENLKRQVYSADDKSLRESLFSAIAAAEVRTAAARFQRA